MKIIGPFCSGVAAVAATLAILAIHNIVPTASAQATRVVTITDPILNMQAYCFRFRRIGSLTGR
jgi:hypothetical protein